MRYTLLTLIYIIKDWNLSMDEFKPIGKVLLWLPNFLNNIIIILFRTAMFPLIWLGLYLFENNKRLFLRFFIYWLWSIESFINAIE